VAVRFSAERDALEIVTGAPQLQSSGPCRGIKVKVLLHTMVSPNDVTQVELELSQESGVQMDVRFKSLLLREMGGKETTLQDLKHPLSMMQTWRNFTNSLAWILLGNSWTTVEKYAENKEWQQDWVLRLGKPIYLNGH